MTAPAAPPTLRAQTIRHGHPALHLERFAAGLAAAVRFAQRRRLIGSATLAIGDCTADPLVKCPEAPEPISVDYQHFDGCNLGHGGGHNRLFEGCDADLLLIVNPDTYPAPSLLGELLPVLPVLSADRPVGPTTGPTTGSTAGPTTGPLTGPLTGIAEARQLPLDHPKAYDPGTGDTSWASGACMALPAAVFAEVGGFDSGSFFLHCDDVDLSWRVRLAGYRVVHCDKAHIFHDKRLTPSATVAAGGSEPYHQAEGTLMMAWKYSRPDHAEALLAAFDEGSPDQKRAAESFRRRRAEGSLPAPIDEDHRVAQFTDAGDGFGPWRFTYGG